jgi:Helix-turn-helix domain/WD40-like Beta Propeller Repeat
MRKLDPVSLADLADAGVRLRPTDAVTIVRALILQVASGILPGVPTAHVIRLAPSGGITVEGPVVASGPPVPRAAQLLAALLRGSGGRTAEPTALRRVIARALQEPSGFATLQELADAVAPFAARDPSAAIKELTTRWADAARSLGLQPSDGQDEAEPDPAGEDEDYEEELAGGLSVSDVRRARRDTGLSLEEVSKRSRIPVSMLRQLEWGYLRNWPNGLYGRTQLVRYARAAGLDRQLVLDAMLPLVRQSQDDTERSEPLPEKAPDDPHATHFEPSQAIAGAPPPGSTGAPPAIIVIDPSAVEGQLIDEDHPGAQVAHTPTPRPQVDQTAAAPPQVTQAATPPVPVPPVPPRPVVAAKPMASPPAPASADRVLEEGWRDAAPDFDPPLGTPSRPPGILDPAVSTGSPRRGSMIAAAAALTLATGAAGWAVRSQWTTDDRTSAHVVRRLPAREEIVARATPSSTPAMNEPLRQSALAEPPVLPASRPVSTSGIHPASDARLIPVDATEDDTTSPAFASAGGVMFADPVQSAVGAGDPTDGLGLRITRVVDDRSQNYHTRPSPDGRLVAFDSDREGERAVFIANADGRNLRRISGDGFAAAPNWAPDGSKLSFVRAEVDNPNVWNIWAHDLGSGESRRLTSNPSGRPLGGSWFPDGHRIAYSSGSSIIVLDVASSRPAIYPSPQPGRKTGAPAVSPDGRWVIYQVSGDGAWLLDLSDGSSHKVLSDPSLGDFTWSPDGSRVAYYNRREGEWNVWVMAAR